MVKGFKIKIYPTKQQEAILLEWMRDSHNMWNFLVNKYKDNYPLVSVYGIKDYTQNDLINEFGETSLPKRVVLNVIKRYSLALTFYFKKINGKPKFHKYNPRKQSICFSSQEWVVKNYKINFPKVKNTKLDEESKSISINKEYVDKMQLCRIRDLKYIYEKGSWYIGGAYYAQNIPKRNNVEILGLDWGIKTFMTASNGDKIDYPKSVKREYWRIRRLKELKKTKIVGSKNYEKLDKKIDKAFYRLNCLRKDFIEKETTKLCSQFSIAVEKVNSLYERDKYIRLASQIFPYSTFYEKLKFKCDKFGTYYYEVDPKFTSQTCSNCGKTHKMSVTDRVFICDNCGLIIDRDINAAINIKNKVRI